MKARLGFFLFLILAQSISLLPISFLYRLSDAIAWSMNAIFAYRKKVIDHNLDIAFPQKNKAEKIEIRKLFYSNLADIILESLKAVSINRETLTRRYRFRNPEILEPYHSANKKLIALAGHIANWEWGVMSAPGQTPIDIVGFYKPLSNKYIDQYLEQLRDRFGMQLISIADTSDKFKEDINKSTIYVLVADQNPANKEKAILSTLFDQETYFLHGPEKYAKHLKCPVFYIDISRMGRSQYEFELIELWDGKSPLGKNEITNSFKECLEKNIARAPENWLWSHKRWKHNTNYA